MCIDVAGVHYLERLHRWGRRMTTADYLKLMKEAKLKRKRKAVDNRLEAGSRTTRAGNEKALRDSVDVHSHENATTGRVQCFASYERRYGNDCAEG